MRSIVICSSEPPDADVVGMKSLAIVQEAVFAIVSWNYVPLYALVVCAIALAVKIPAEVCVSTNYPLSCF